jgi:HEPN domain-containing protein
MPDRSRDWLHEAEQDLDVAHHLQEHGYFSWSCFAAQQSAEKAVKALHLACKQEAWGHVVARLLSELPEHQKAPAELIQIAKVLDGYYIPARYPNGHPEGPAYEHYGPLQSEQAIHYADQILQFVRSQMA